MEWTKGDVLIVAGAGEYEYDKVDTICILNGILEKYNYSHYALRRDDDKLRYNRDWYNFDFRDTSVVIRLEAATREHAEFVSKLEVAESELPIIFEPFSIDIKRQAYDHWVKGFLKRHIEAYVQTYEASED